jgi:ABC-type antimicrobial peptide transport system permease subunit
MPAFYLPMAQHTPTVLAVVARTSLDARELEAAAQTAVRSIDPGQPVDRVVSLSTLVAGATAEKKFVSLVALSLGVLAVVVGAVGMLGAAHSTVSERLREFALRVALGSSSRRVWWLAIRQGLLPVAVGSVLGCGMFLLMGDTLTAYAFSADSWSLFTLPAVLLLLLGIAVGASLPPARKALSVDPMLVLKQD